MAQSSLESANDASLPDDPPGETIWTKKLYLVAQAAGTTVFLFVAVVGGWFIFSIVWIFQAVAVYLVKASSRRVRCARLAHRPKQASTNHCSPVESKTYALLRNGASLLAIAAVLIRAVTLLDKAQAETFQTQSMVADCHVEWLGLQVQNTQIVAVRNSTKDLFWSLC